MNEPSVTWQVEHHHRILRRDVTAFAELCEIALPHLVAFLQTIFPAHDSHLREQVVIDCLLDYQARPHQYDPEKLALWPFLRMATRRDMLNMLDKQGRYSQRLYPIDDPHIAAQLPLVDDIQEALALDDWLQRHTDKPREEIITALQAELEPLDQQMLWLMLDGVRETSAYATIMGLTHLDVTGQRREVKKAKDRILKKVQRFGQNL
jgi:RNA polymerase sigma-70 factor (ECF subfamily)